VQLKLQGKHLLLKRQPKTKHEGKAFAMTLVPFKVALLAIVKTPHDRMVDSHWA